MKKFLLFLFGEVKNGTRLREIPLRYRVSVETASLIDEAINDGMIIVDGDGEVHFATRPKKQVIDILKGMGMWSESLEKLPPHKSEMAKEQ